MMNISVKSVHFDADVKLLTFIEKKLNRLEKLFERDISAEVLLKLHDTGGRVQEKITEIHLHLPGGWVVDKKSDLTFESAINTSVDTLRRQLVKRKERLNEKGMRVEFEG